MDNAAQRVTLDVIGRVGFEKDFGATTSLTDAAANEAFDLMTAGMCLHFMLAIMTCRLKFLVTNTSRTVHQHAS